MRFMPRPSSTNTRWSAGPIAFATRWSWSSSAMPGAPASDASAARDAPCRTSAVVAQASVANHRRSRSTSGIAPARLRHSGAPFMPSRPLMNCTSPGAPACDDREECDGLQRDTVEAGIYVLEERQRDLRAASRRSGPRGTRRRSPPTFRVLDDRAGVEADAPDLFAGEPLPNGVIPVSLTGRRSAQFCETKTLGRCITMPCTRSSSAR